MKKLWAVALAIMAVASVSQAQLILMSDDFNRASGTNLGTTAVGYVWTRYYSTDDSHLYITNNTMVFNRYDGIVYPSGFSKNPDFVMDMDLARPLEQYTEINFHINFRMQYENATIASGGVIPGYRLEIWQDPTAGTAHAVLLEDTDYQGIAATGSSVAASVSGFHVKLTVNGNLIAVEINGTEVLSYDSTGDANPAADSSSTYGYINFNSNKTRVWSIDNLSMTTIPPEEPILVSDSFNRASGTNLGATVEGYAWAGTYIIDPNKVVITNGLLFFDSQYSMMYPNGAPSLRDCKVELDLSRPGDTPWSTVCFNINFRMESDGANIGAGGATPGYQLQVYADPGCTTAYAVLNEDGAYNGVPTTQYYPIAGGSENPVACSGSVPVTMVLKGTQITISLNGTEVISYNAFGSSNPAATGSEYGQFNLQGSGIRDFGVDNLLITELPYVPGGYDTWADQFGGTNVIGATTNDYDGDGLINLYEYGLGGNPTNALDQGTSPQYGLVEQGGTTYFGYVYPQLTNTDSGLTYSLETCTNLVSGTWTNAGYTVLGTNLIGGMNMVSNYTDTVDGQKFVRLMISTNTP